MSEVESSRELFTSESEIADHVYAAGGAKDIITVGEAEGISHIITAEDIIGGPSLSRETACGRHRCRCTIHPLMLRGGTINVQGDCLWQAQMPLHYPYTDVERGLFVTGTDGLGGQVILAPMRGDHNFISNMDGLGGPLVA